MSQKRDSASRAPAEGEARATRSRSDISADAPAAAAETKHAHGDGHAHQCKACCGPDADVDPAAAGRAAAPAVGAGGSGGAHDAHAKVEVEEFGEGGHKAIVDTARKLLGYHVEANANGPVAKRVAGRFHDAVKNDTFWNSVLDGLKKADTDLKYTGVRLGFLPGYQYHFFDPDKKFEEANYLGTSPNACGLAVDHFFTARSLVVEGKDDWQTKAGFELGLALHYVTDLCQPMHAANFINNPPHDWRHSAFEKVADEKLDFMGDGMCKKPDRAEKLLTPLLFHDLGVLPPPTEKTVKDLVIAIAVQSKGYFTTIVKPALPADGVNSWWAKWPSEKIASADWNKICSHAISRAVHFLGWWCFA